MRIKLNRGPFANRIIDIPEHSAERYEIAVEEPINWREFEANPNAIYEPIKRKRGHYQRSNVVLKNGTLVFEWMGWRNGGKAF
jgi:hypothetical protein